MDPPDPFSAGGKSSPAKRSELQGPRPTPLKVNKDSYKIKKPPVAPHPLHHHHHDLHQPPLAPPHPAATTTQNQNPQPVIIYAVSPKVIHTTVSDFMNLVQRLTGSSNTSSSSCTSTGETSAAATTEDISPAARLASIERASPSERERSAAAAAAATGGPVSDEASDEVLRIIDQTNVELGQNIPSILSPAPATLPPVSPPGLFSPTVDPLMQVSNMFIPSPSTLFSAPIASPSPSSSYDLFVPFFDFQ